MGETAANISTPVWNMPKARNYCQNQDGVAGNSSVRTDNAFTLIEIMLALGLMALIAGIAVVHAGNLLEGLGERPVAQILQQSVRHARFLAASQKEAAYLRFDPDTTDFLISNDRGEIQGRIPTGYEPGDSAPSVTFYKLLPETGIGPGSAFGREHKEVHRVTFHPDRSSTPFLAVIKNGEQETTHHYDPFSDAELRPEEN